MLHDYDIPSPLNPRCEKPIIFVIFVIGEQSEESESRNISKNHEVSIRL